MSISKNNQHGFVLSSSTVVKRLIMAISGVEKHGKTHFALTAPAPLCYFNIDFGDEGVLIKFEDKEIWRKDMEIPSEDSTNTWGSAKAIWDDFLTAYHYALSEARSVVIDTATELWDLLRLAELGKLTQVLPHKYVEVNAIFRQMIRDAYSSTANLILVHKLKDEYVGSDRTGGKVLAGFKDTGYMVQVTSTIERINHSEFCLTINDCRHDAELNGETFEGDFCNFPFVASMVVQGTTANDWM